MGAITHNKIFTVLGDAPPFIFILKFANFSEGFQIINETNVIFPGELIYFIIHYSDTLAKIFLVENYFLVMIACCNIYFSNPGAGLTCTFKELSVGYR